MDSYADLLNLNFMYSLRTGNLLTDMMIAALLPLISGAIAYITRTWWPQLVTRVLAYFSNVDSTSASFRTVNDRCSIFYGYTLRIALSTYVTKVLKPRFDVAELKYITIPGKKLHEAASYTDALRDYCFVDAGPAKELPMELTEDLQLRQADAEEAEETRNGDDKKESNGQSKNSKTKGDTVFTLTQYRHRFPAVKKVLGGRGVLKRDADDGTMAVSGSQVSTDIADLERLTRHNEDAIQLVLDRALAHYRKEYKQATTSTDRYLYQPLLVRPKLSFGVSGANEKDENEGAMACNRYLLQSEKTFSALFFPMKSRIMQLIDDFEHKTGKYAIPGYPQKLVLLLYGPPGTGKTSLAKAVAAYTKRDLFAISLSRIRNNEELLKYMFSAHVKVKNEKKNDEDQYRYDDSNDGPKELDPTKLVYILEDVDATTAVVLKDEDEEEGGATSPTRVSEGTAGRRQGAADASPRTTGATTPAAEGTSDAAAAAAAETEDKEDDRQGGDNENQWSDVEDTNGSPSVAGTDSASAAPASKSTEREVVAVKGKNAKVTRKLTIEGLTNALNGVLDFPQRIVIMTTNHIERLHPSLLRPGVVTMKLHMHNFDASCAVDMVSHYFSHTTVKSKQLEELRDIVEAASTRASKADTTAATVAGESEDGTNSVAQETKGFSPAELEQRCAECESVEELLEVLRQGSRVNVF